MRFHVNLISVGALASSTSNSNNQHELQEMRQTLDLQSQHFPRKPHEAMASMAAFCKDLRMEEFDVYGDFSKDSESSFLRNFEGQVATKFGKEDAVFMPSGVMAQNIALLIHSRNMRHDEKGICHISFACHHSSHLLLWEENSYSELVGMNAVVIDTSNKASTSGIGVPPIMLGDVESTLSTTTEPLSTFILELPHRELGGKLTPWADVLGIAELCKKRDIRYHCDGARIFEAAAGYGMALKDVAEPFDSVYISFYKGLGAISGAMLIGKKEFCDEARIWLRRFGGNLYTLLPYFMSSYMGFERYVLGVGESMSFDERLGKLRCLATRISEETKFSSIASFDPATPETNMIHLYLKLPFEDCIKIRDKIIESMGVSIFSRIKEIDDSEQSYKIGGYRAKFEWTIGEANGSISNDTFVRAWEMFCKESTDV